MAKVAPPAPAPAATPRRWPVVVAALIPGLILLVFFTITLNEWWLMSTNQIAVIPAPHRGDKFAAEVPASTLLPMIFGSGLLAGVFAFAAWRNSTKALLAGYLGLLAVLGQAYVRHAVAAEPPKYSERVADWTAAPVPARKSKAFEEWRTAANYSQNTWIVSKRNGQVAVSLDEVGLGRSVKLPFTPSAKGHTRIADAIQVSDGWLVAFNDGEFGAAVFWFDELGSQKYQVSDHQVVTFLDIANTIYAVEGLDHLGLSRGSMIKLTSAANRWQATTVAKLASAPYVATSLDGKLLVVTSDSLLRIAPDGRQEIVVKDAPWELLFPNSVALSSDNKTLYIGMRKYVAAVTLSDGALKMLAPDHSGEKPHA